MTRPDLPRWLLLILVIGVVGRLAAALTFPVFPILDNTEDTIIYDAGAKSLAAGDGYRWGGRATAFFPVGWPLLLSFAYRLGGESARSGQILNVLLSLALLAATGLLARRLFGARVAAVTVAITALAPHQLVYPAFLMSEVAFTAFFVAALALLALGTERRVPLLAAGVLMGCATLIRGLALVYPLAVAAWAHFGERRSLPRSALAAFLFGLAMLVPLTPWAVRNHDVFGRWVLVANDGGWNFLMGNHVGATGARHEPVGGLPDTGDEIADDREAYRQGLDFIRRHPVDAVALWPLKLVRLTAFGPLLTYRTELRQKWPEAVALPLLALDQLLHLVLWGFALRGAVRALRAARGGATTRPPDAARPTVLPLAVLALWGLVHLAFLGGARYFFPMLPLLTMLAARELVERRR